VTFDQIPPELLERIVRGAEGLIHFMAAGSDVREDALGVLQVPAQRAARERRAADAQRVARACFDEGDGVRGLGPRHAFGKARQRQKLECVR
jgi:hypothetical protein